MLKATNDPIDMIRRQQANEARAARETAGASGTQTFQATRKIQAQIDALQELVIRMPSNAGAQETAADWVPPVEWATIAQAVIPRPADKTRVVVSANGFVTAIASGATLGFRVRIVVNGVASPFFDATVEAGAAITRAASYPSFVREIANLTAANVTVQLQLSSAGSYSFDRRASLSVLAGFSII